MKLKTKQVVLMGMFGALAAVLMLFEVPLPFIAPSFYGLDISEVPVLVGTFAMGPVAGIVIEAVKILVKLLLKPSTTGFVGEFANFVIGCSLVVPAGRDQGSTTLAGCPRRSDLPPSQDQGKRCPCHGCGNHTYGHCRSRTQRPGDDSLLFPFYAAGKHSCSRGRYPAGSQQCVGTGYLLRSAL